MGGSPAQWASLMARASRLVAARQLDATVRHAAGLAAERAGKLALQATPRVKAPGCRLTRLGQELRRSSWASSPRELTPALVKMFRRWNATVRGDTQHWAAMSLFDRPCADQLGDLAFHRGQRASRVDGSRLRAVSPDARSSWVARAASGSARRSSNVSSAARRWVRASTRRWVRRRNSP